MLINDLDIRSINKRKMVLNCNMMQNIELLLIQYLVITFAQSVKSQSNCMPLTAFNRYGTKPDDQCFEVSISDLNQMIIHSQTNIIGFTFNFKNGSSQSYNESLGAIINHVIDLNNIYMTGVEIYVGEGIEALKFQLYDSTIQQFNSTEIIGNSQKCFFFYLNSSFLKSQSLVIDSIQGCVDNKQLNYFPFLEFTYSFSQCPIQVVYPKNTLISTTVISSTISSTSSSSTSSTTETTSLLSTTSIFIKVNNFRKISILFIFQQLLLHHVLLTQVIIE